MIYSFECLISLFTLSPILSKTRFMKKILAFALFFAISMMVFPQKNNPGPSLTKQDYLQKSKNQNTAAWILRGGGGVLFITGIIWLTTNSDDVAPNVVTATGAVCILTSVPLFMAARKNKRRAMEMSFDWQRSNQLQKNMIVRKAIPSLTLRMGL